MAILNTKEIAAIFADPIWAARFPLLLTVDQAAELAQIPKATIYSWSSQGRLDLCKVRVGKYVRFLRNEFYLLIANGELK